MTLSNSERKSDCYLRCSVSKILIYTVLILRPNYKGNLFYFFLFVFYNRTFI